MDSGPAIGVIELFEQLERQPTGLNSVVGFTGETEVVRDRTERPRLIQLVAGVAGEFQDFPGLRHRLYVATLELQNLCVGVCRVELSANISRLLTAVDGRLRVLVRRLVLMHPAV